MNYFEFLNKSLENNPVNVSRIKMDENTENRPVVVTNPQDGSEPEVTTVNVDGVSIFNTASKEEVENINYENILKTPDADSEDSAKLSPLEWVLRKFFGIEEVNKAADKNGDGEISVEEAKEYVNELIKSDGNAEDLSLNDFSALIEKYGINLENYLENSENPPAFGLNDVNAPEFYSAPVFQYNSPTDTFMTPGRTNYSSNSSAKVVKTLDNMTLDELGAEKDKRVDKLNEKLTELKQVQSGETEAIKSAKQAEKSAKEAYETAVEKDEALKQYAQAIKTNNQQIEENDKKIGECKNNILDKELEVSNQEQAYNLAQSNLEALKGALSELVAQRGSVDESKKSELEAKINETQSKIAEQEALVEAEKQKLEKVKNELEELRTLLGNLEEQGKTLQAQKEQYEKLVDERASEVTKAAKNSYNEAVKKVKEVTEQELEAAQEAYDEAKESVKEVNDKIKTAEARKIKFEYSFNDVKSLYGAMNLEAQGLNYEVFEMAITGYNNLPEDKKATGMLGIFDTTQSADKERYYLIDLNTKKVVARSVMKTGSGNMDDVDGANRQGSHATLSGFEQIGSEYYSAGMRKQALKIHGLEAGINDQAYNKGTVVHYASGNRTWGCKGFAPVISNGRVDILATNAKMRKICPKGMIMFTAPTNVEEYKELSVLV